MDRSRDAVPAGREASSEAACLVLSGTVAVAEAVIRSLHLKNVSLIRLRDGPAWPRLPSSSQPPRLAIIIESWSR